MSFDERTTRAGRGELWLNISGGGGRVRLRGTTGEQRGNSLIPSLAHFCVQAYILGGRERRVAAPLQEGHPVCGN